jgi:hypothetical protein
MSSLKKPISAALVRSALVRRTLVRDALSRNALNLVALGLTAGLVFAADAGAPQPDRSNWPAAAAANTAAGQGIPGTGAGPGGTGPGGAAGTASPGGGQARPANSAGPFGSDPDGAAAAAGPVPHVQPFAGQLGGAVRGPGPKTGPVTIPEGTDGCDHAYGEVGQCVPWQFPPGVVNRCGWLAAHGFKPLAVHGRDRHGLDRNHDGVACGPGDT